MLFQVDASKVTSASGEGVLANFFNSLLHKKTGSPASPKAPGSLSFVQYEGGWTVTV